MVVNPLIKDAMQRSGEKMPDDGVLVMSTGNVISCAADSGWETSLAALTKSVKEKLRELKAEGTTRMSRANLRQIVSTRGVTVPPARFDELLDAAIKAAGAGSFFSLSLSGGPIACAASSDIKSILMSDIPSMQFQEIKDGYYDASAALRKLAGALTGVRGLESELAIAKAAMAQMNKSKLGQFV